MRRTHTRLDLVERAHDVGLRVASHGAAHGKLGALLHDDVEEGGTSVLGRHSELEHIERVELAKLWRRDVVGIDLDLESPAAHLGELARATALLLEELNVLETLSAGVAVGAVTTTQ